ncbi:asparaginase domain-containing protein [Rhodococcus sp. ACT016]|uniref:asparaginase domain-containing protein n=1 Tax=Rhodococcus sp. ACT016 TaxID=3134808 RepID=UPI003D28F39E
MITPTVAVIGTGGTIAGRSHGDGTRYQAAQNSVNDVIRTGLATSTGIRFIGDDACSVAGQAMTEHDWRIIRNHILDKVADPVVTGVIVTAGTDTLEELSYFLHLSLPTDKPVVVVGAMRPLDQSDSDAPANLEAAVSWVTSQQMTCRSFGVVVAMDGVIHPARGLSKLHTHAVNSIQHRTWWTSRRATSPTDAVAHRHTTNSEFAIEPMPLLPRVDLLYGYAGDSSDLVHASIDKGAAGIVFAGVGNGNMHPKVEQALTDAVAAEKVVVVRSSRVPFGSVQSGGEFTDTDQLIPAGDLPAPQARVLLLLALASDLAANEVKRVFQEY